MHPTTIFILTTLCLIYNTSMHAADMVIFDFNDPQAKQLDWIKKYQDNPKLEIVGETTANDFKLKMTLGGGDWPGFTLPAPKDISSFEALRFEAHSAGPLSLTVRIDDPSSSDYNSRFHHNFKLKAGSNLCQIEIKNIAQKINAKNVKAVVIFCNKPPNGLVVHLDNFVLGKIKGEDVPFIPYADRKDLQPKSDVVTPHFPVGKPLAGGPLKTFFLTSIVQGREVVEMSQRMDIEASVQHWDTSYGRNTWGMGDFYGKRGHKTDYTLMQEYLASSLQGPEKFDSLMLFTPQGWERYGKSAQDALIKRVKEDGCGLVFIFPYPGEEKKPWPNNLREINALIDSDSDFPLQSGYVKGAASGRVKGQSWSIVGDHPITRGVPLSALPFEKMTYQKYNVAENAQVLIRSESGDPILAVREVGKGRVATFAWRAQSLTPQLDRAHGEDSLRSYRYWEVIYSLLNRASLWTAKRDLRPSTNTAIIKDPNEHSLSATVHKNDKGLVTDWSLEFIAPAQSTIKTIELQSAAFINAADTIELSIAADKQFNALATSNPNAAVTITLHEQKFGKQRTLQRLNKSLADMKNGFQYSFSSDKVTQIMVHLNVEVRDGDDLLAQGHHEIIVTPDAPLWDDYEILMWHVGGLPFLRDLEDNLVTQFGSTGIMETRWYDEGLRMRYARAGLRLMVHDLARKQLQLREFTDISAKYNKTKDSKLLIRDPSYADSNFLKEESARVTKQVTELKKFHPTNYILCDEPSITYYRFEFDFDFHPENITRFKKYLEDKFKSIDTLNTCLGTTYKQFGEIYPPVTAQARTNKQWPIWNEWRQHNDTIMADGYKMYKDAVQAADPKGTISLSGTQTANPFDGFDWAKLSPHFGSMQGYGYGDQERKRMSFNNNPMINAVPAGYGRAGRAVDFQIWDSVTNHGGGHVLFWWIAFRNPDLTFCKSAYDYMSIFKEMKSGIGRQFLLAERELTPIALHYSMNSMRSAYSQGKDKAYHEAADKTAKELVAIGYDPQYFSDEQIANGELLKRGMKAVFLPANFSIAQGKNYGQLNVQAALKTFAESKGLVFHREEHCVDEFLLNAQDSIKVLPFSTHFTDVDAKIAQALQNVISPAVSTSGNDEAVLKKLSLKVHKINGHHDARIVTVLRPPVGTKEVLGGDGVIHVVPDASGGNAIEDATLDLSVLKPQHVYAIRSGEKLVLKNNTLALKMQAGDGTPLALLPYAINDISVTCSTTKTGDATITWQLKGSEKYAAHAVRISILEDGVEDPILSTNATTSLTGNGTHTVRLALEDTDRKLSVVVKDVLTGVKSAAQGL